MTLLFKVLSGNRSSIIEDNSVYVFDKSGVCTDAELPISPKFLNGAVKANYISVLASGKHTEIAVITDDNMRVYDTKLQAQKCVMNIGMKLSPFRILRRDGKQGDVTYNQAIFVFLNKIDIGVVESLIK